MNTVLKLLVAIVLCASLSACAGYNEQECYEAVIKAYPDGNVYRILGEDYRYIVEMPDGDILYVETMASNHTRITNEVTVIRK